MNPFCISPKLDRKFDYTTIPLLLMISILLISACTPILSRTVDNPPNDAISSPSETPILTKPTSSEPVLASTSTSISTETVTPNSIPTPTPAPTSRPTSTRPLLPAPVVPNVSSVISTENASRLTRLVSLGEGDLLNLQLSPDETQLIIGTSNGILVVDPFTFEKANFLPTAMPTEEISFVDGGTKITAKDEKQGHVWSWPDLNEIWHGKFPTIDLIEPNNTSQIYPSDDFEFVFSEQHYFKWLTYPSYKESYSDALSGLLRTNDGSVQYLTEYKVKYFSSSPNNEYSALATVNNELVLIQYQDGKVLNEIQEPGIKSVQFSPDGKSLIGIFNNQIKFWSIPDLVLLSSINAYGSYRLTYSPDNSILGFVSEGTIRLIRTQDNQLINAYSGASLTFASDSKSISIAKGNGLVSLYKFNEDRSKAELIDTVGSSVYFQNMGNYTFNAGIFSGDNSKLLVIKMAGAPFQGSQAGVIVYDVLTGGSLDIPFDLSNDIFSVVSAIWLPNIQSYGMILCKELSSCHLAILNVETGTIDRYFNEDDWGRWAYTALKFSPNGDLLISAQGNNFVYAWDIRNSGYWKLPIEKGNRESLGYLTNLSINFTPDNSSIHYFDPFFNNYLINTSDFSVTSMPYGERYFYPGENLIGVTDGALVRILRGKFKYQTNSFSAKNTSLDYNPAKKMLATVSNEGISVWDLSDLESEILLFTDKVARGDWYPGEVSFSPDGYYVAAHDKQDQYNNKISVWNSIEGSRIFQFGYGYGNNFAFSADSKMIAVSSHGGQRTSVSILDLASGQSLFSTGNWFCEGSQPKLAFSPDGKYLAVLCSYAYPQIWGIP